MASYHGKFVWCELMTTDTKAATAFYGAVVGWSAHDSGLPDHDYTILSAGEAGVAGLMGMPSAAAAAGASPGWIGYIGADDVDAYAQRVAAAGGAVHRGPEDIPSVGRFCVVSDPQGAMFVLFTPNTAMADAPPPNQGGTGHVGWHELSAADQQTAFDFYAGLFGWTKAEAIDMGPMGTYQLFATGEAAGAQMGGMMTCAAATAPPCWLYYFNVADIDAAAARVTQNGGKVVRGPHPVPGGSRIIHGTDPQGAVFALVQPPG